ncbi:ATP-dependent nuclease [Bradyrhizobium sp. SZCCHNRI1003]|uniref:ATP-dependent nuclease n=1 Tax=Bradyrhizobium sp. SZCCHNRI1003 TaxID=3057275 RepID=UPI002915D9EE|nr:AAA family ATPase [Bradyrhizobium sp. SZCCHNRI1003]
MHISKLQLVNYRNFANANILFNKGINTIIGENGSGKTNLLRAIRLLLDDNMRRSAIRLDERDFHRGLGDWRGHWIIISLEFDDVSQDEAIQSLFLHGAGNIENGAIGKATYNLIFRPKPSVRSQLSKLEEGDHVGLGSIMRAIKIADYEAVLTGKSSADFTDPAVYSTLVGDFENIKFSEELDPPEIGGRIPNIFSITNEVSFTFVQALRDVVADFQNNRTNPLLTLLRSKSGEINPTEFAPITTKVAELNSAIEGLSDVKEIRTDIRKTINDAAGDTYSPSSLSIRSDLSDEADRLFQSLKLFVGESDENYEGAIHELSLGGANLIYLTLKLLEFKYQKVKQSFANLLLIEEPEAHIHTHIQKTLFDKLQFSDTQVIYSTHSTHISEVSNVQNVNILGRVDGRCEAFHPTTGLTPDQIGNIQRYLDAVRSNLLFAKSVILVEGDAEEILIPILVKKVLGVSLDELGISLINIRSTGFSNVAVLFHDKRIRKRCSIVTDLDAAFIDLDPDPTDEKAVARAKSAFGSQAAGLARKTALEEFCQNNSWVEAFFAPHTFEVDFVAAGNSAKVVAVLNDVYKTLTMINRAKAQLESTDIATFGQRTLTLAGNAGKGWFAILLGKVIDHRTIIPDYIHKAIFFAHGPVTRPVIFNILSYRLSQANKRKSVFPNRKRERFKETLERYGEGGLTFDDIRQATLEGLPSDEINNILAGL